MAVIRTLARIRRQTRDGAAAPGLSIGAIEAELLPDGARRLQLALHGATGTDGLRATNFAIWERDTLITDYSLSVSPNPSLLIFGFVIPRIVIPTEPLAQAVEAALTGCLQLKRPHDLWWIQRYLSGEDAVPEHDANPQELLAEAGPEGADARRNRGFWTEPESIRKVISTPGQRRIASASLLAAMQATGNRLARPSGVRHLFIVVDAYAAHELANESFKALVADLRQSRVAVHAILPEQDEHTAQLIERLPESSAHVCGVEDIAGLFTAQYGRLLNRYEITYRSPHPPGANGLLQISGPFGCASREFKVEPPAAAA